MSILNKKGFTLIELLICMAIAAILSFVIVAASLDKIKSASDTVAIQDISLYGRASESYAASHGGYYPANLNDLFGVNEISRPANPPDGYTYTVNASPPGCTGGISCTSITLISDLKSVLHASAPYERYESITGKACEVSNPTTTCP
jgi:prepilin-type N-terminal cleavage/methylation domain-containing protein